MFHLSHNIFVADKTVSLSPLAVLRKRDPASTNVKSAARTLQTLELLAVAKKPLRAIDISRSLGISPSSADALLKTMVNCAYLIFDPISKHYHPSPRFNNLAASISETYFGSNSIDRLMQSVYGALGHLITLSTAQGAFMQVIDLRLSPTMVPRTRIPAADQGVGFRSPMFGSCVGAAWLASQSEDSIHSTIRLCRRQLGKLADHSEQVFERILRVRKQGYAYGGLSEDDDIRTVAISLPPTSNGIVLVIAATGPPSEFEARREEIAGLLKERAYHFLVAGGA